MLLEHLERASAGVAHEGKEKTVSKSLCAAVKPRSQRVRKPGRADGKLVFVEMGVPKNAPHFASAHVAAENGAPKGRALGLADGKLALLASIGLRTDRIVDRRFM